MQIFGIDFDHTYAPVAKLHTFRLLLAYASINDLVIDHLDVVTAFLNPDIDKPNLFMEPPPGMEDIDPRVVGLFFLLLLKALYGLRQSPMLWFRDVDAFLLSIGFVKFKIDPNLYIQRGVLILLYVDDFMVVYSPKDQKLADSIKEKLKAKYKMSDLGRARRFLGLEISCKTNGSYTLGQPAYIRTILKRFNVTPTEVSKSPMTTSPMDSNVVMQNPKCEDRACDKLLYMSIIGSLMYAALGTRPDISFAVCSLSRYNSAPLAMHLTAARRVLKYLQATSHFVLDYSPITQFSDELQGFSDSDFAGSKTNRKSTGGSIFFLRGPILWTAKSQSTVALSTAQAEYMAVSDSVREAIWLRNLYADITNVYESRSTALTPLPLPIGCDNQSALKVLETGIIRQQMKHVDVKYHHAHDEQNKGTVKFSYVPSTINVADILTKALPAARHEYLVQLIGLDPNDSKFRV